MQFHDRPVPPRGVRGSGASCRRTPPAEDLTAVVSDEDAAAAALFTRNQFPGAPVILGRETIQGGRLRVIVANSKCSNVATGAQGLDNAGRMAAAAAAEVAPAPGRVLVSSTGVIGVQLPIETIERGPRRGGGALRTGPPDGGAGGRAP